MKPNDTLAKILAEHKCGVAYKDYPRSGCMDLWITYEKLAQPKPGSGLDIWGDAQKVFDNISSTVRRFYPNVELSSQVPNRSVVFRITYGQKAQ